MRRALLLNGFMASGKSTIGRLVARARGAAFVDLDERVEQRAGASVAEIFAARGEAEFRRLERAALRELLGGEGAPVVALGGGALLSREVRLEALDRAVVVTLRAAPEELARRAAEQPGTRPLLGGEGALERARELLEQRAGSYAECHAGIATDGRDPEVIAREVERHWERDAVAVAAGAGSYCVHTGSGVAEERLGEGLAGATRVLLVTDDNVGPLHGARLAATLRRRLPGVSVAEMRLPAGERFKTLQTAETIWQRASQEGLDRSSWIVGVGGGVVTDVAGFAAATWMRGIRWVGVPTTLLAMVDASVGGKTAVDLGPAKNCVGAFWQPSVVYCDPALSSSEPALGNSALSEVVKTALIGDEELLELLEREADAARARRADIVEEMVRRCVRVKARIVGRDARESGVRAFLNLGHTLGHALEAVGGYDRLSHGQAVSLGLVAALRIGEWLGITDPALSGRVVALLGRLGLPTAVAQEPLPEAVKLLGKDKKRRGGQIRFVLVRDVGRIELRDLELNRLAEMGAALAG